MVAVVGLGRVEGTLVLRFLGAMIGSALEKEGRLRLPVGLGTLGVQYLNDKMHCDLD